MPSPSAELTKGLRVCATRPLRFLHSQPVAAGTEGTVTDIGPVVVHVQFDGRTRPSVVAPDEISPLDVAQAAVTVPAGTSGPRFTQPDDIPGAL